ncbi:MAG: DUF4080 domain-containing protein [Bacillota bacterium]|jgi:radical SAM superfamily enzyme YgiQ (UPF0313 family)
MRVALFTLNSQFVHSSLALRYLQAASVDLPIELSLLEYQINDDQRTILAELGRLNPDLIACSCYIWNVEKTLAILRDLKQVMPQLVVVLGGPEVGPRAEELLKTEACIDYVIVGEGERAFRQLLLALSNQSPGPVPGVFGHSPVASNRLQAPMPVGEVPEAYHPGQLNQLAHKLVYVETSRGCPLRCSYCLSAGDKLRFFPMERVLRELDVLLAADIPLIKFVDRTFNANPERAMQIMRYLLDHRGASRFHFEICADLLTEDMLQFMSSVPPGIFQLEIGVQSTNPPTLRAINRKSDWSSLAATIARLQAGKNLALHLDLIAGLPEQDWDSIAQSFNRAISLLPDRLQLGFLKVLPGTPMKAQVAAGGYAVSQHAPYEVLESPWLKFSQLNQLHLLEQVLEDYYNSGLARETLSYLIKTKPTQPFQLFNQFAQFRRAQGWDNQRHNQEALLDQLAAWLNPDRLLSDLLTIDRARTSSSWQAGWRLPDRWRAPWSEYLNRHLSLFAPRTYKQAQRSVFPVALAPFTLEYYQQPRGMVAVVDQKKKSLLEFIALPQ